VFNRAWPFLFIILISTLTAGVIIAAFKFIPKKLPIPAEQLNLAQGGVNINAAWQPVIRNIEGIDMVLVPAGCFNMGSTDEQLEEAFKSCDSYYGPYGCQQSFENEQPGHQVCLTEPYWIDLTPVTNLQYGSSSNRGQDLSPYRSPFWPRESVTWQEAVDFCTWRGARLPTEAEWEFAGRGPDTLIYPFGDQYDIHKVTLRKISPPPVGQKPEGASWVGALDMSGGISEWVADWYGSYSPEAGTDPVGPPNGELRIARGGSWFAHAAYFVRTTFREPLTPDYATSVIGFRCVRDHTP
jgi:formylglycine-generating enzyme required for sulfatase activity